MTISSPSSVQNVLEVKNLVAQFSVTKGLFGKKQTVYAVDGVSFCLPFGKTIGLVGESGCGKSTLGRSILKLTSITSGEIFFCGENITQYSNSRMRPLRKEMQIVFQKDEIKDKDFEFVGKYLDVGDFIGVEGKIFKTKTNQIEKHCFLINSRHAQFVRELH